MKKHLILLTMMSLMSSASFGATKVVCAVNTESTSGSRNYDQQVAVKTDIPLSTVPTEIYRLDSGRQVYVAETDKGGMTLLIGDTKSSTWESLVMSDGNFLVLISSKDKLAFACAKYSN